MQIFFRTSSLLSAVLLFFYYLKLAIAQGVYGAGGNGCPPTDEQLKPIRGDLKKEFEPVKKLKPGINPKDVDFAIYRVAKDVFTSKRWSACNYMFDWKEIEKDAIYSRTECYKPTDLSKEAAQKEFKDCMAKIVPPMALKYGPVAIDSCECFAQKIIPNYQSKYKKILKGYFEEFKTLKHRNKK